MNLQVLLVEDNLEELEQFKRDLPGVFESFGCDVDIHPEESFDHGLKVATNPLNRFDLVISDTYRGKHKNQDAAVFHVIKAYQHEKFCPLIVMSSGVQPAEFEATPFLRWANKASPADLNDQIGEMLEIGVPQTARKLHNELDNIAGSFLWGFLDQNWADLEASATKDANLIERIIRRRAAITLSDLSPSTYSALDSRYGLEYYIYPALEHSYFSLGDILRHRECETDIRLVLTPHCHLFPQSEQSKPKADHVLTVKTVSVSEVLGEKLENTREKSQAQKDNKLLQWARSPAQTERKPEGRHWYLPKFLDIPYSFCDFLQVESLKHPVLECDYVRVATLLPPYAEALQECFSSFYRSVGIPRIAAQSIRDMVEDEV